MYASPFKDMAVDDDLNVLVLGAGVPKHAELVSINGVHVEEIVAHAQDQEPQCWKSSLNAMLPSIMSILGFPLNEVTSVVVRDRHGEEHALSCACPDDKSAELIAAVKEQYASILRLGSLSGLTPNDMSCVFTVSMAQLGLGDVSAVPEELLSGMQGMAQKMAQGMGGGGASGGQCPQQ